MKGLIIILVFILIFYKVGGIKKTLELVTIPEIPPTAAKHQETEKREISHRERLEIDARYVIIRQGQNPDTVKYMSDGLLQAIITDYKNTINQGGTK